MKGKNWQDLVKDFQKRLEKEGKSPITIKGYLKDLKLFKNWYKGTFGDDLSGVNKMKDTDLLAYKSYLQAVKRQAPATINRHIAALRGLFSFAYELGLASSFLAEHLKPLETESRGAPDVLSHKEILRLLATPDKNSSQGKRDFAILQLFFQCGLRLSEVGDLRLGDIKIGERKGILRVQSGKGSKFREVPLNKTARLAIKEYLEVRPNLPGIDHLFLSQKKISPKSHLYL